MREKNQKIVFAIFLIIILLIVIILLSNIFDNGGISKVKKMLSEKYDSIKCIDINCNGIMAINEKDNTSKVKLYDGNGNIVANYSEKQSNKKTRTIFALSKNYFLTTITDSKENVKYTINDKNGKELYSTSNKLQLINDYFIVMSEEGRIGDIYTIIDSKGNEKYSGINEYESYLDGKYIYFEKENNYFLLDEKGNKIIEDYKISEVVVDDNKNILYFILKDEKTNNYYYFNVEKASIVGDAFNSYKINEDNTLTVTQKDTSNTLNYNIDLNGKKDESSITSGVSDAIKEIKKKINSDDYYLYTLSVISNKQNQVLVDNKKEKSFGVLDIKTNKYISLYSYDLDKYYSSLSMLDSTDDHTYAQISCNSNVCESTKMIVFDLTDSKELFRLEGTNLVAQNYVQYKNGYKIVKYSYQSNNSDYKGKYVLYDDKNNELLLSNNQIAVIDSEYVVGKIDDDSLILYSSNEKKNINSENNLAQKIKISKNIYYKYGIDDKITIVDTKGKEIHSSKNNITLDYSDRNIYSIGSKTIKIYNIDKGVTNTYNLLDNESLTDSLNNKLGMFEDAIFINNNEDNYFKVINSNGKLIKKVNNVSIKTITTNKKNKKAYIISQKKVKDKIKYGLYVAK